MVYLQLLALLKNFDYDLCPIHKTWPSPAPNCINKISALALKGKVIEDLDPLPSNVPCWVQEICNNPWFFGYVSDHFKTQRMCERVVEVSLWQLKYVLDHFKTQDMCDKAMRRNVYNVEYIHDHFMTQEISNKAIRLDLLQLRHVPDHFKT